MACSRCHVFLGDPCASCRTYLRIGWLVTRLEPVQEGQALAALRNCGGALEDLAEIARKPLPPLPAPPASEGDAPLSSGTAEGSKVKAEEKTPEEAKEPTPEAGASKAEPLYPTPKVKKERKEKTKKKDKKAKSEEVDTGGEVTPGKSKGKERKRKGEEALETTRVKEEEPSEERAEGEDRDPGVILQERVDRYVSENPDNFALGHLPVRGSAGRHFRAREEEQDTRRPAEPRGPPSRRHGGEEPRQPPRRGQPGETKKKSKGSKHRRRGREWREGRTQQQWRPRQR